MHVHFSILNFSGILLHPHVQESYRESRYAVQSIHRKRVFTSWPWTVHHRQTEQASCACKASTPFNRTCGRNTCHAGQGTVNETDTNERLKHVVTDVWEKACICDVFYNRQSASTLIHGVWSTIVGVGNLALTTK